MRKSNKILRMVLVILFAADVLSLTGCGRTDDDSQQADTAVKYEISEEPQEILEVRAAAEAVQTQADMQAQSAGTQSWTQEKIDEANRRDRAILEEKIKAAGGISEDEAIEIARKAMETDIGEKAKELEVCIFPDVASNGWKLSLFDITDWDEYKDKGDIAYSVTFSNTEEVEPKDFCTYKCFVNAVDGSICGAYSISGDLGPYWDIDDFVWYEH